MIVVCTELKIGMKLCRLSSGKSNWYTIFFGTDNIIIKPMVKHVSFGFVKPGEPILLGGIPFLKKLSIFGIFCIDKLGWIFQKIGLMGTGIGFCTPVYSFFD